MYCAPFFMFFHNAKRIPNKSWIEFFFNALLNVNNFVGWTLFFFVGFFSRYDAIVYDFLMFGIIKKIKSIEIKSVFIAF